MAQALPFVGAAIGGFFGGPAGAQAGFMVGSLLSVALAPTQRSEGSRLTDLRTQTSTYGKPIPLIFGTGRLAGNIIWAPDIREEKTTEKVGKNQKMTNYTYFGTCAIAICEGPIAGVRRVWADGKIVYDASMSADTSGDSAENFGNFMRIYNGTEGQLPDPTMQAVLGANRCPAHRGVAYAVLTDLPLEKYGNRLPNVEFEVISASAGSSTDVLWHNPVPPSTDQYVAYDSARGRLWSMASAAWPEYDYIVFNTTTKLADQVKVDGHNLGRFGLRLPGGQLDNTSTFRPYGAVRYDKVRDCIWAHGSVDNQDCFARLEPNSGKILAIVKPSISTGGQISSFCVEPDSGYLWYSESSQAFTEHGTGAGSYLLADDTRFRRRVFRVSLGTGASTVFCDKVILSSSSNNYSVNGNANSAEYDPISKRAWFAYWKNGGNDPATDYVIEGYKADDADLFLQGLLGAGGSSLAAAVVPATLPSHGRSFFAVEPVTKSMWFYDGQSLNRIDEHTGLPVSVYDGPAEGIAPDGSGKVYVPTPPNRATNYSQKLLGFDSSGNQLTTVVEDQSIFGAGYKVFTDARRGVVVSGNGMIYQNRMTATAVSVADIFKSISEHLNVPEEDYDVSAVAGADHLVQGFGITTRMSGRSAFEPLMTAYALDVVESGAVARVSPRGHAALAARIPNEELAAMDGAGSGETDVPIKSALGQDMELPQQVEISFSNPELEYRQDIRRYKKIAGSSSVDIRTVDLPIVMAEGRATVLSKMLLSEAYLGRTTHEIQVGIKYIYLEPGDVIDVDTENGWLRMLISKVQFSPSGLLRISASSFDYSVYDELATTPTFVEVVAKPVPRVEPAALVLLDIPLLTSTDDNAGFYVGAHTLSTDGTFSKPSLFVSADGSNYAFLESFATPTTAAVAIGVLPACDDPELWDTTSTLTVHVLSGALYGATDEQVLNGANAVLLGEEVLQFANAKIERDGRYTLSRLLRGRKGTEAAIAGHGAGEKLVLLDGNIKRVSLPVEMTGISRYYKLVSPGQDQALAPTVQFASKDVGQECLSPVLPRGSRAENGDLAITWVRRTRIGGELRDKTDALLGEASEAYDIDVLDGELVKRTVRATSPALAYTAAQQIEDFGAPQTAVSVRIYQISAVAGRGFPLIGNV